MSEHAVSSQAAAGPEELLRLKAEYLIPCTYHFYRAPPQIVAGEGVYLFDHDGRRYLDCFAGVTVMNAGHNNAAIVEPAIRQIRSLQHTTSIYLTEPVLRLAEKLAEITPGNMKRSFFTASGSEAVEGALLTAALHTGRERVVALENGLHGRTRWAMSVTGAPMWRTDPYPLHGVAHLPFGDTDALRSHLERHGRDTAALIAEPIQGNGGVNLPAEAYWPAVRRLCDRHGVLLIFDETQTGMGRTGRWFAGQHWGITPDIMTISKALGNGFPIAAFITGDEIASAYTRPGASTFGGNPVSAAAALATIRFHERYALSDSAAERGAQLLASLEALCDRHDFLAAPRGRGLMIGVPVLDDHGDAGPGRCDGLLERLREAGVLAGKTGPGRNVLTFMPPLTISEDQIGEVHDALESILG